MAAGTARGSSDSGRRASPATHVGLNLIFLVPGETGGMEVYARELIPALLAQAPPGMRFTAFINREAASEGSGPWEELIAAVTVPVSARNRVQWVLGEQALLPTLARRHGVDLMHSLASTAPLWGRFRRVVTVHDLIYARFPEAHSGLRDKGMRLLVPWSARRADLVIADSHSTRNDLVELLGIPAGQIDVVPLGIGTTQRETALAERDVRERFGLGERPVVLALSAKRPHKNLLSLIGALARIASEERPVLVLPGYPTAHEAEMRERARELGVEEDIRFAAWVSTAELEGLWALARAFVFPSLYEGFGLPVLEAMARGVPVACSSASSLPEVAGDAALLFDPDDESAMAGALRRILSDEGLRERLVSLGRAQAGRFSWARTGRLTLESYARVLGLEPRAGEPAPVGSPMDSPPA
ncbi:MAG: hypothetical protein QOI89_2392 [Solirubrobacteraceae bacterium]|jgi:glycosyltransferase involved in cell wall biosynthesis|nr:hypothetical protein [Solirubrobacteraceae bacterium]